MATFRDINPAPLNALAYYDMVSGIGPAYLEGRDRGIQNALVLDSVARDAQSRNLMRELVLQSGTATGPGAPAAPVTNSLTAFMNPDGAMGGSVENRLLADLAAVNPELAFQAMAVQRDAQASALADRQRRAQEATRRLQIIAKRPDNKGYALKLWAESPDPDNPLAGMLEVLEQQGAINRADGIDDEEADIIIQSALEQLAPIAALDSAGPRVQSTQILDDGTIAYITSDGQLVRTDEKARNPYQITDIGGGRAAVDRMTGQVQMLSTPEQETAAAAERSEAEKLAGTRGQTTAQRWSTQIDEGLSAADSLPVIRRGLELLKGGVETGGWDSVRLWASNRLGVTGADEGELSANLGKAVLAQLRSTFGAQFTEREGARLAEIEAGFGKSTAANIRLLEQAAQLVERTAKRGITAARNAGDADSARMIEEAMNMRLTYDGGGSNNLPAIALDDNGVPIRQSEVDALLKKYGGQ